MIRRTFFFFTVLVLLVSGVRGQDAIAIEDEISYPFLEKLIATARSNYPRGEAYDSRIEVAEKGVKKARLSYFDIFSFSYLLSPFKGTSAINPTLLNGYQFGFFANVGSLLQKPTVIRQAKDELTIIEKEKEVYELSLVADVKRRYFEYVKAKAMYRVVSQSVLDAQSMIEDIKYRFEKGEVTYETYNQAMLDKTNRLQTKISFAGDLLIAKSSLEELLGKKLEEIQ
ncbi:TolC family protein [Salmonirosea aquatica]